MAYRDLLEALKERQSQLKGKVQARADCLALQASLSDRLVPGWFVEILSQFKLCGAELELAEEEDASGLGVSMGWLELDGILSEAKECQPGIAIVPMGFLPVGSDLTGSGDPYFLDLRLDSDDPLLVRVPHDYAMGPTYPLEKIEVVCPLSNFIQKVQA